MDDAKAWVEDLPRLTRTLPNRAPRPNSNSHSPGEKGDLPGTRRRQQCDILYCRWPCHGAAIEAYCLRY